MKNRTAVVTFSPQSRHKIYAGLGYWFQVCFTTDRTLELRHEKIAYAKTKAQISFAVTVKLIDAFVFATRVVQFLFLNLKLPASSHLLCAFIARFVSNLFRNHIIGFLMMRLMIPIKLTCPGPEFIQLTYI